MNVGQKGFAPILIALFLTGAGGTSYYLINKQSKLLNNQNQQNLEINETNNDDWKTHTDIDDGFEIKYPSNWESPFGNSSPSFTAGTSIDNDNRCVVDAMGWSESNDTEITYLVAEGYVKTLIKIDGVDAIRLTRSTSDEGFTEAVYFEFNDKSFRISRSRGAGDKIEQDCIKNFNQIISTFKFLK